jgi:hypothetical protein
MKWRREARFWFSIGLQKIVEWGPRKLGNQAGGEFKPRWKRVILFSHFFPFEVRMVGSTPFNFLLNEVVSNVNMPHQHTVLFLSTFNNFSWKAIDSLFTIQNLSIFPSILYKHTHSLSHRTQAPTALQGKKKLSLVGCWFCWSSLPPSLSISNLISTQAWLSFLF